jgi:PAS domain S-box-containing protein
MTNQLSQTVTLLIIDDSESDRVTYLRYLQLDSENTYNIIETEMLEEGLEMWRSQQPDIVLIDLNLPDGDGLEFLEAINVDNARDRVPVIMLTGQGNEKMAVNAMKLGAADYLVKGDITAKLLTTTVKQVLRETLLSQQLRRSQQQQILISEIALRIRESLNLEDISNAIVKEVRQFINADRAAIYKFTPDMSGTIVAEDIVSPWLPCLNMQVEDTCFLENLGGAYREGMFFVANDIYAANLTDCHIKLLERFQVRANLVVPILLPNVEQQTTLWGLLILHQCSAPRIWQESDIQLLQQLSVQLAIGIKQAIAYQQVQTELTERKRVELSLLEHQAELEERNNLLEITSADLECSVEELRVTTEDLIAQHRQLEYEQIRYQNLFNFAPDVYLVTDITGRIGEANQAILDLLAISHESILGKLFSSFIDSDHVELFYNQFTALLSQNKLEVTWELIIAPCRGKPFPAEIVATKNISSDSNNVQLLWIVRDISDRKRAEQTLQQLNQSLETKVAERTQELGQVNQLLQTVLDSFPLAVFWKDRKAILLGCNQLFATIYGVNSPSELIGKSTFEVCCNQDEALNYIVDDQLVMESGIAKLNIEEPITMPSGEQQWLQTNKIPLRNADGNVIGVMGTFQDISDRKRAEIALQRSEDRFRLMFDSSVVGMLFADFQGHITDANDRFLEMLGYTREDFQTGAIDWMAMTPPEYLEKDYACMEDLIKYRQIDPWEKEYYRKDGSRIPIIIGAALLHGTNNETICVILDISDRKNAEAVLRASDQRWQFALESVGDGIWDWNAQTNEVFFSQQWKALLGYADDEIENKFESWENLVHPDDIAQAYEDINKCLNRETLFYENEHRLRCKDGSYKWILARGKVFEWDVNGHALRMMGTHTDLSARKQAEAQLKHINEELLRATKLKDEFLANMSHELRTPLNSILGISESLQEEILGSLNETQLKAIATVESSGEHLLSLINDVLDLSKISAGMIELDIESVSVTNLCSSSLVFIKQQAFNKRIQIHSHIPPLIDNININIDERRIKQVLINLLTNAVKFTPNEGRITLLLAVGSGHAWQGEATISQRLRDMNSPMIVFQIVDTGIGIAPNDLQRLFQPFVQIDSALNRQYEGTGLGLALVKQIVELHGGQVSAESEVGKGSCFTFALPYVPSQPIASKSKPTSTDLQDSLPRDVQPENAIAPLILLAEDNEANIQTFISYLNAINYRVIVAKNGEEAVTLAKENFPDIILMDVQMPIMDGLEATKQIRRDPNLINTPIIALTALAMEGDRDRCLAAGANEYLSKPIKLKQLATVIQQLLSSL